MPKEFDSILEGVKTSLSGKVNPKTKKKYSESDMYAISMAQYKEKYSHMPNMKVEITNDLLKYSDQPDDFDCFCEITKVDEENRMVYGTATDETIDSQKEIIDFDASVEAFDEFKKWRNLRVMHQPIAAGTIPIIEINHSTKKIDIGAKVVDDNEWRKVKEKVYKGFSIGGKAFEKVTEFTKTTGEEVKRITKYALNEISLVDRPANPVALISFFKRDFELNEENKSSGFIEKENVIEAKKTETNGGLKMESEQKVEKQGTIPEVQKVDADANLVKITKEEFEKLKKAQETLEQQELLSKRKEEIVDVVAKHFDEIIVKRKGLVEQEGEIKKNDYSKMTPGEMLVKSGFWSPTK